MINVIAFILLFIGIGIIYFWKSGFKIGEIIATIVAIIIVIACLPIIYWLKVPGAQPSSYYGIPL